MKILITGGAGFIGSNLTNFLLRNYNCKIVVVDNLLNGDLSRLDKSNRLEIITESVLNIDAYAKHLNDSDFIFHLACIQISKSNNIPNIDLETNAISTLNILDYLSKNKNLNLKRFIYTSSCSVYGDCNDQTITEQTPISISSIYAATKYLGENYTMLYHKQFNIPVSVIRYSNVYGYNQTPKDKICGVIGKYIYNSIHKIPLTIYGDGNYTRDYTFIEDVIDATLLIAFNTKSLGRTYNVSTNLNYSNNDLIQILKNYYSDINIQSELPRIIDNIYNRKVSYHNMNIDFNWTPKHSLQEGIEKTINWFNIQK
jgi:UDP-glucose 4-epimerase